MVKTSDEQKEKYEEANEKIRLDNAKITKQIKEVERENELELHGGLLMGTAQAEYERVTKDMGERFKD